MSRCFPGSNLLLLIGSCGIGGLGCGGDSTNMPLQNNGGAGGSSTGGVSSTASSGGSQSGGLNGIGGIAGAQALSLGGASFDAGPICSRNFDWMDPKCGGLAAPCASESCTACGIAQCTSGLDDMFGSNWINLTPSGPCASIVNCIRACDCDDRDCYRNCPFPSVSNDASLGTLCGAATYNFELCVVTNCKSLCQTTSG